MSEGAGRTVSVRVPPGLPEEIKAATGLPFSTFVRHIIVAMRDRYRAERRSKAAAQLAEQTVEEINQTVNEHLDKAEHDNG